MVTIEEVFLAEANKDLVDWLDKVVIRERQRTTLGALTFLYLSQVSWWDNVSILGRGETLRDEDRRGPLSCLLSEMLHLDEVS